MPLPVNESKLASKLRELLDFEYVDKIWVVGSLVEENEEFTQSSDIDIICKTSLVSGERDEFMDVQSDEVQTLLKNPEDVWGEPSEGVELEYNIPVFVDGSEFHPHVHLIAIHPERDIHLVGGTAVRIY